MPNPSTASASRSTARAGEDPLAAAVRTLDAILTAIEGQGGSGPAMAPHRAAIRRQGQALVEAGGSEVMRHVLAQLVALSPRGAEREAIVTAALTGLAG
ncbi:hypothetical protein [Methylobacterium oryzisoli]|uniref:hypothetical protein n=1 Tax=Methylobacterium oryzisoli TaxID=3385502 RepID=UPI003891E3ED